MADAYKGKVAIPSSSRRSSLPVRGRASRACDQCRKRKTRCDATRPVCEKCRILGIECSYSEVKRVRERMELETATSTADRYASLLLSLTQSVDKPVAKQILKELEKVRVFWEHIKKAPLTQLSLMVINLRTQTRHLSSHRWDRWMKSIL